MQRIIKWFLNIFFSCSLSLCVREVSGAFLLINCKCFRGVLGAVLLTQLGRRERERVMSAIFFFFFWVLILRIETPDLTVPKTFILFVCLYTHTHCHTVMSDTRTHTDSDTHTNTRTHITSTTQPCTHMHE